MASRFALCITLALAVGCSSSSPEQNVPVGEGDNISGRDGGVPSGNDDDDDIPPPGGGGDGGPPSYRPSGCGDGILTRDEACDDGNTVDGDGCSADCLVVAPGVICPVPGELCRPFARCGDSVVAFPEQCDDGNTESGDGCSASCKVELGFKCDDKGGPGSCTAAECGNGIVEGAETCDDGNRLPLDGCSADCVAEPSCANGQGCSSRCGDGLLLGDEECDDGNTLSGDGCSDTCKVEPGYVCTVDTECEKNANGECILRVPAVFRDFSYSHSDFLSLSEQMCGGDTAFKGLVEEELVDGKPVKTTGANCTTNLHEWYRDIPNTNVTFPSELVLYQNEQGAYVNRWGPNGERWVTRVGWPCSNPGPNDVCTFDGNPLFFPVDGIPNAKDDGGELAAVSAVNRYGMDGTVYSEQTLTGMAPRHNFAFTSEVTYWFEYQAGTTASLEFDGDDDVWVFVNGKLALDIGGLHPPVGDSFVIDAAFASRFGLVDGGVYEIKIFHAERKPDGSTFRLTLSGFKTSRSECTPVCGDGILGVGEECDDGVNDGGYNECAPGCKLGEYCGDGIVQEGEDCDDGNRIDDDDCNAACRHIVLL